MCQHLVVDIGSRHLLLGLGRPRQHAENAVEAAHLADFAELIHHILQRELALHHLLGDFFGFFFLDDLLGLFDQADDIAFITYREYLGVSNALLLFVAIAGPDIVCPDRRNRTLPLIFARPLTGVDYAVAKLGAMFSLMFGFAVVPQVVLFLGQLFVSDAALDYLGDHLDVLWQVPLAAVVLAAFHSSLILAIASFTTRRLIAAAAFLVLLLVSSIVSGVLTEVDGGRSITAVFNLIALPLHVRDLVFLGHPGSGSPIAGVGGAMAAAVTLTIAVIGSSASVFVARYRWVES